ncbi:hypothetical protein FOMPIDRAFT_1109271, partial [Fomitopsis schrenkii]
IVADSTLTRELSARWIYRDRMHASIAARLWQIETLPGFSGKLVSGCRLKRSYVGQDSVPLPSWA